MAITAIKILHRSHIPGTAGYDTSGNPKQGKVRVIGEFNNSTGYTTGGEVILRHKLGVGTVDTIQFWVKGTLPTASQSIHAQWDDTNQKFCAMVVDAAPNEPAAALGVVRWEVVGDAPLLTEGTISDSINTVAGTPLA